MTNREKLLEIFPYLEIVGNVIVDKRTDQHISSANYNWLSAEYEETIDKTISEMEEEK